MKQAFILYRKELREMLRDKRVIYAALIGPVFLVVLMTQLLAFVQKSVSAPKSQKVYFTQPTYDSPGFQAMKDQKELVMIEVPAGHDGRKMVADGKASLYIEFPSVAPEKDQPEVIKAVYDEQETKSQIVLGMVSKAVAGVSAKRLAELLSEAKIDPQLAVPVRIAPEEVTREEKGIGSFLAGFLPYMIVVWAFYGGFGLASDLVAGEKEKQTLETLMISPLKRRDIAIGKFLSLLSVSTVSSLSSLIAVLVMGLLGGSTAAIMFPNGVNLTIGVLIAMVLVVLPLAAMFAGLLLAISAFARNTRECQTYLSLLSFIVIMPAVFSQFIGFTDFARAKWINFVPILNSATVLREALLGKMDVTSVALTVLVSCILAAITIWIAIRLFDREKVLVRV